MTQFSFGRAIAGFVTGTGLLFTASTASAQSASPQSFLSDQDRVVAQVNGSDITVGDLMYLLESLPEQYQQTPLPYIYPQLIDRLVGRKLLAIAGKEAGLAEDKTVQRRIAYETDGAIEQIYLYRQIEEAITDEMLKEAYDAQVSGFEAVEEVSARHILLEDEDTANAIIKELDGGADFAALAKEKSTGPSGPNGGDLGFFQREQMVPPFAEAAFSLEKGAYTASPVQTQFGYHVILVEDKRMTEAPSFEDLEPQLRQQIGADVATKIVADLKKDAEVKQFDPQTGEEIVPEENAALTPPQPAQ